MDEYFLRRLLKAHSKTPKESLYLETGCVPIKYLIKQRRLMYLKHILSRNRKELISRVYHAQERKPVKDDWAIQVKKDAEALTINIENLKEISKNTFKKKLKEKISALALKDLNKIKESHSKVKDLQYKKLEIQNYMKQRSFKTQEIHLLFKLRTRMLQVKNNFKNQHENIQCDLCNEAEETQEHLLDCQTIIDNCEELYNDSTVQYNDIFSQNPNKLLKVTKLFAEVTKVRNMLLNID